MTRTTMPSKATAPKAGERAPERRCGTCRWYEPGDSSDQQGVCEFPLPARVGEVERHHDNIAQAYEALKGEHRRNLDERDALKAEVERLQHEQSQAEHERQTFARRLDVANEKLSAAESECARLRGLVREYATLAENVGKALADTERELSSLRTNFCSARAALAKVEKPEVHSCE